jgi:hypothetical protein
MVCWIKETIMKTNSPFYLRISVALAVLLISGFTSYAQYPASTMLVSNTVEYYSTNSADDYLRIEQKINTLAKTLQKGHAKYPNFKFIPAYTDGEISGYIVTGVADVSDADKLAICLMQLDMLGNAAREMNEALLPSIPVNELSHVSKKVASR